MNDGLIVINQNEVDALLNRLQQVLQQISDARLAIAPLETGLALAYNDYQTAVGRLFRETNRLQNEIEMLNARIDGIDQDTLASATLDINEVRSEPQRRIDPEEVEK